MVNVYNLNNKEDRSPPEGYESWRQWWIEKKHRDFYQCSRVNCAGHAAVGAHVQEQLGSKDRWYIVPLCTSCNNKPDYAIFQVKKFDLEPIN